MNVDGPYLPYLLLLAALIALGLRELALRKRSEALRRALAAAELRYARDQALLERVRAQVQESEERFHQLADSGFEGIALHEDGIIVDANLACARMFGYERDELIGRNVLSFVAADSRAAALAQIRSGDNQPIEMVGLRRDGSTFLVESQGRSLIYGTRTVRAVAMHDISVRKQAETRLQENAREMIALYGTLKDLTMRRDLPVLLRTIVERAAHLLGDSSGGLYLCDPARREVRCVVSYNTARDYVGVTLKYGEGLAGIVAERGEPINIDDYRLWSGRASVFEADDPFKAVLAVPMRWQGAVSGVLTVNSAVRSYADGELNLLSLFADQAAIAVENARLFDEVRRLAITDDLTGIANRRHLFLFGAREFQRARRFHHSLGALMLDLDHFKPVNDTLGHAAGDTVLRAVAEHCVAHARDFDTVARYGGEEFAILLPETGLEGARELAERLRRSIAATSFVPGQPPGLTVSIGAACIEPDIRNLEQLLDRADQALYAAKQAGRNRVAVWEPSGISTVSDAVPWAPGVRAPT